MADQPNPYAGVVVQVPDTFFAERKKLYEEHQAIATQAKSEHDSMFDLLKSLSQPIPKGVERLEKRGRKSDAEKSAEDSAQADQAKTPAKK